MQLGADVDGLDTLSRSLDREASRLSSAATTIGSVVGSAWWRGRDAETFRSAWSASHANAIRSIVDALRTSARDLERQAAQQRQASVDEGPGSRAALSAVGWASTSHHAAASVQGERALFDRTYSSGDAQNGASVHVDAMKVSGSAHASASYGADGALATGGVSATYDLFRAEAETHSVQHVGSATVISEDGTAVAATATAEADGSVHVGPQGVDARANAGMFAGGTADVTSTREVRFLGVDVKASEHAGVSYGAGAEAHGEASLGSDLRLSGSANAALGLGGNASGELDIDVSGLAHDLRSDFDSVF